MDQGEALLAIAQIALGLAGFGGVFVAVGGTGEISRIPANTYRLVLLQSTALATLVLSLLPIAFEALGVPPQGVWASSSALMAALVVVLIFLTVRGRRRDGGPLREGEFPGVAVLLLVFACSVFAGEALAAMGVFGERTFGVFFTGLVFLVAFGSYLFARMLFLWRN